MRALPRLTLFVLACMVPGSALAHPAMNKRATFRMLQGGFTFTYPSQWHLYRPTDYSFSFTTVFAYLGNVPLSDPCTRTSTSLSCAAFPYSSLPEGAVLVRWGANGFIGWTLHKTKGRPVRIAGRPAKLDIEHHAANGCPRHTSESIIATIARTAGSNNFEMIACLSMPGVTKGEAQVLVMLRSVQNAQ